MTEISFQTAQEVCEALSQFHEARTLGDKDLILTVQKIDGRQVLQTIRLSQMSFCSRFVRWLGFGDSTLKAMAGFLVQHEPALPCRYKDLQLNKEWLRCCYHAADVETVSNLSKERYLELKTQKVRGIELFKKCVAHHNQAHRSKVYVLFKESEKKSLFSGYPMGPWPGEKEEGWVKDHYQAPIILSKLFPHVHPFFKNKPAHLTWYPKDHCLGFCYEYGLGVPKNLDLAFGCYLIAYEKDPENYSAAYNLARLYLQRGKAKQAADTLNKIQDVLFQKIQKLKEKAEGMVVKYQGFPGLLEKLDKVHQDQASLEKPLGKVARALLTIPEEKKIGSIIIKSSFVPLIQGLFIKKI